MGAAVFQNNEQQYLHWLAQHPNGHVLDARAAPSGDYLVLHTAKCKTIRLSSADSDPACFTGNGYIKICAVDIEELHDWAGELGINDLSKKCSLCHPIASTSPRRFNWTRDELILALDLYHSLPAARGNVRHPGIVELSELLQDLPIHPVELRPSNFRNPNGVAMKLGNFLVCDPAYKGAGLHQGARIEQDLWDEFSGNLLALKRRATAIREHYPALKSAGVQHLVSDDGVEEGGIMHAMHRYLERDKSAIRKKKKDVFDNCMALQCEVCDFDFAKVYGELGSQFAECHHTKPVAKMKPGEKTKQSDLSIVCANCHRMLHRGSDVLSIADLKVILSKELALQATKRSFK
jgi:5-methylcytosine-specific restriction protein A